MKPRILALICTCLAAGRVFAATIHTEKLEYKQGDTTLEGLVAYEEGTAGRRPAVVIFHQWKGLGTYEAKRAEMIAAMGYVVFAADIYGKGVRPTEVKDAGALAGKYKEDRGLLRARATAALKVLQQHPLVDPSQIAAIGYCFGGTASLELARSGANIAGIVSFHGGLSTPAPQDAKSIKAKVLVLHGADDPFVPPPEVQAFETEMKTAGVDWQLVAYGGAVHSFTHWEAGSDASKGAAYHERSDKRSWLAMQDFFTEIFKAAPKKPAK